MEKRCYAAFEIRALADNVRLFPELIDPTGKNHLLHEALRLIANDLDRMAGVECRRCRAKECEEERP
jgi:hypothetical protein